MFVLFVLVSFVMITITPEDSFVCRVLYSFNDKNLSFTFFNRRRFIFADA